MEFLGYLLVMHVISLSFVVRIGVKVELWIKDVRQSASIYKYNASLTMSVSFESVVAVC